MCANHNLGNRPNGRGKPLDDMGVERKEQKGLVVPARSDVPGPHRRQHPGAGAQGRLDLFWIMTMVWVT